MFFANLKKSFCGYVKFCVGEVYVLFPLYVSIITCIHFVSFSGVQCHLGVTVAEMKEAELSQLSLLAQNNY